MPQQEVYFEHTVGDRTIAVLKTYDRRFAREAFESMSADAQVQLWHSLQIDLEPDSTDSQDLLWEEVLEAAREDGSLLSFFVVHEHATGSGRDLFVSPDWPTAEAFAKSLS